MFNVWTQRMGRQSVNSASRYFRSRYELREDGGQGVRQCWYSTPCPVPQRFPFRISKTQRGTNFMADENLNEGSATLRAEAMNLTDKATLTMLIVENPNDVQELIRPILMRYVGDQAMSEDEMALCQYFNDAVLIREIEGFDQRRES